MPALLLQLLLGAPPVQHPSSTHPLSWDAPAECPALDHLRERVELLAPGCLENVEPQTHIGISVEPSEAGYTLEFVLDDRHGGMRRKVVAEDCERLTEVAALFIAVFLDPGASAESIFHESIAAPDPSEPEPEPEPEPELREPSTRHTETATTEALTPARTRLGDGSGLSVRTEGEDTRGRAQLRGALRVVGGGGYGPTNTATGAFGGGAALLGPRWRAELGATWILPREVRPSPELGGRFDAWFIAGRGCFVPRVGPRERIELPVCAALELGRVRGQGVDELPVVLDAAFTWLAPGVGAGLWFAPLDVLAFGAEVQLAVATLGGRFLIETTEIQRIAPVSVRGFTGVELRFPAPRERK